MIQHGFHVVLYYNQNNEIYEIFGTQEIPSTMVVIGDKSIVERIFLWLKESNIESVLIMVPVKYHEQIESHIAEVKDNINVKFTVFPDGWSLLRSLPLLAEDLTHNFILIGLNLWVRKIKKITLWHIIDKFIELEVGMGIVMNKREEKKNELICYNPKDSWIKEIIDDRSNNIFIKYKILKSNGGEELRFTRKLVNSGIYFFRKDLLEMLKKIWVSEMWKDMETVEMDLIPWLEHKLGSNYQNKNLKNLDYNKLKLVYGVKIMELDEILVPVQNLKDIIEESSQLIKSEAQEKKLMYHPGVKDSIIGENCIISNDVIIKKSTIGKKCIIKDGARITGCNIMSQVTIGANASLSRVVVCMNATIGDNVNLKGVEIGWKTTVNLDSSGKIQYSIGIN